MSDDRRSLGPAEIAQLLEQVDWRDVTRRLLTYASLRLSVHAELQQAGRTPDDYVQEAVALALEGRRGIPSEAGHSPVGFFSFIIDSLISHDAEKARRRRHISVDDVEEFADPTSDFEGAFSAREEAEQFVLSLDADLQAYVRLRLSGDYLTAEEYAMALSTTVSHVYNLQKRLKRQLLALPRLFKR